jgi:DNA-directed RNA polymerase specialized sigma24 family protein
VLLAQSGDRDALESVLREVQADLLRYIVGVVGESGAEDVLQDVFLDVWRNLKWLREPELFHPWVWRIASRRSFKFLKCRICRSKKRSRFSISILARPSPVWPMDWHAVANQWKGTKQLPTQSR